MNNSCWYCKYLKHIPKSFHTDETEAACKKHDREIDTMFDEKYDLTETGCLQFKPKEKKGKP